MLRPIAEPVIATATKTMIGRGGFGILLSPPHVRTLYVGFSCEGRHICSMGVAEPQAHGTEEL